MIASNLSGGVTLMPKHFEVGAMAHDRRSCPCWRHASRELWRSAGCWGV